MTPDLQDYQEVIRIANRLSGIDDVQELRGEVLKLFQTALHADRSSFFMLQGKASEEEDIDGVSMGIENRAARHFQPYSHKLDPFIKKWGGNQPGVATIDDAADFQRCLRSELFSNYPKPQSNRHMMVLYLGYWSDRSGILTFFRSSGKQHFSTTDRTKAKMLLPALAAAFHRIVMGSELCQYRYIIDAIATDLSYAGFLILDSSLAPVFLNRKAVNILAGVESEPADCPGQPSSIPGKILERCRYLLNQEQGGAAHGTAKATVTLPGSGEKKDVRVEMRRIARSEDPWIFIGLNPQNTIPIQAKLLCQKGLSPREIEVIALVAQGMTNLQIAGQLNISRYTVENHLKSIYRKLNVPNRTSLLNRIMTPRE